MEEAFQMDAITNIPKPHFFFEPYVILIIGYR